MTPNPLMDIQKYGQSVWIDNIQRAMITSGQLQSMIDQGLMGMTSNPTIFEKAISGSRDYDDQMKELVAQGADGPEILNALMIKDIQMAADLFHPVYTRTKGRDGFVSIEINPTLAHQTEETFKTVKQVHSRVDRTNVMIKVPGTPAGIPAFEDLICEGISINVTLIFSIETYKQVGRAYISGLKRRHEKGLSLGSVRSVASVFVSRVDTMVDKLLEKRILSSQTPEEKSSLKSLIGKVAVANTKMIYQQYQNIFSGEDFQKLKGLGAHVQRPLWGSTGTKNPNYSDLLYVEELIGAEVVNTIPASTLDAFEDHGKARLSIEEDLNGAQAHLHRLSDLGIDLTNVTDQLQEQGVKAFADSHQALLNGIAEKKKAYIEQK